jgi:GT2 family glycosyltransferase
MRVAVAIVGFRNSDDIVGCLTALGASTYKNFEVVICENGGPEAYAALKAAAPEQLPGGQPVRVILAPCNLGYGGGVNLCLRESPDADAWWVLNPDTEPQPGALALQVERLSVGDCEAVGCTVMLPDGRVQSYGGRWQSWLARAVSIGHGHAMNPKPDPRRIEIQQNYLNGAAMLIGRRFLELTGPMREEYFLYCEEVEWCLRGMALGARLGFDPGALVMHHQGTTTGHVSEIRKRTRMPVYLIERNRILLTRDHYPARLLVVALTSLALVCAKYVRSRAWPQLGYALSGWLDGLRDLRGPPTWHQA